MEWPINSQKFLEKVEQNANRNPEQKNYKFREKTTREMIKLHERGPIDRQLHGFWSYSY